jgi:hypothetical protein
MIDATAAAAERDDYDRRRYDDDYDNRYRRRKYRDTKEENERLREENERLKREREAAE